MGCFDPQSMIYDPSSISSLLHSRFFASIRGSKSLNESALRGRIALPGIETRFQAARIQREWAASIRNP
jgi:hypothetical protein